MEAVAEAVDVEEGQREEEPVGGGDLPAGGESDGIGGEVVVGKHRAFGDAGGARGIDDSGGCFAIEVRGRDVRRTGRPLRR